MDIIQILRSNSKACKIILSQNIAVTMKKYGLTLSDAKKVHNFAALTLASLEAQE